MGYRSEMLRPRLLGSIWIPAAGYFLCYVPFTALTKAISSGSWSGSGTHLAGATLLPVSTAASVVVMVLFLLGTGWWRNATQREVGGYTVPSPTLGTFLSGLCTAVILTTTTLAYTFENVSIVLVMLIMRGGVLVIAPVVDALTGRRPKPESWVGLALSFAALLAAFSGDGPTNLTTGALVTIGLYLGAYFLRFRIMSRMAKSNDVGATLRYFAEEQLVIAPITLLLLGGFAALGLTALGEQLRVGFTSFLTSGLLVPTLAVGVLSQGAGIFGTLVFLDPRENTFSVPVNRCASVLAGVVAAWALHLTVGSKAPNAGEHMGAALVVAAIVILASGALVRARQAARVVPS